MHCPQEANPPGPLPHTNGAAGYVEAAEAAEDEGRGKLTLNLKLRTAAREHALAASLIKWWAGGGPRSHTDPVTQSTAKTRIKDAGYCPEEFGLPVAENGLARWFTQGSPLPARAIRLLPASWTSGWRATATGRTSSTPRSRSPGSLSTAVPQHRTTRKRMATSTCRPSGHALASTRPKFGSGSRTSAAPPDSGTTRCAPSSGRRRWLRSIRTGTRQCWGGRWTGSGTTPASPNSAGSSNSA